MATSFVPHPGRKFHRWQERLRAEIHQLEDSELVQAAFDEYWEDFGANDDIDPIVRRQTLEDLREAKRELDVQIVLSTEGRGRLRSFLFNERRRCGRL